jgi:hypothetical protein
MTMRLLKTKKNKWCLIHMWLFWMVANFYFLKITKFDNIKIMCCFKLLNKHSQLFDKSTKRVKEIYNDHFFRVFQV